MKKQAGFTLIELILFIIVTSIAVSGILLAYVGALGGNTPSILQNAIATQTVKQCAEWYLEQRRLVGFSGLSGANCTGTLTIPSNCAVPAGYSVTGSCSTTTVRGDNNYVTITLTVSGAGNAQATLLLGSY